MANSRLLLTFILLLSIGNANAFKIIAPEPFSIVRKNYLKLQVLSQKGDPTPDSVSFDVLYNTGSSLSLKVDQSLSVTLPLNAFNDGVFFVRARIYHSNTCDTLISKFDSSGIPVLLDRQPSINNLSFDSRYINSNSKLSDYFLHAKTSEFVCNNNTASFLSAWDEDSLYLLFKIKDANLNYANSSFIHLFQSRNYLKMLWNSDCIEIGFDLQQDRSEWKGKDDYEFLVDVKGNFIGNRWSVSDSLYAHWGKQTRVRVTPHGTINNNEDTDTGYEVAISIPWPELNFQPRPDQSIGFDIQFYDKDGSLDDAFRTSISGTNPESNDNTSEWASLVFRKNQSYAWIIIVAIIILILLSLVAFKFRPKAKANVPQPGTEEQKTLQQKLYSEPIQKAMDLIAANYSTPELSRQDLAKSVFLSEQYLSSLFKKEVGENLVHYINKYRVEKAISLLQTTKLSISEIAFRVGYNSIQNFNKNFKSIMQKAPSEYRKDNS